MIETIFPSAHIFYILKSFDSFCNLSPPEHVIKIQKTFFFVGPAIGVVHGGVVVVQQVGGGP